MASYRLTLITVCAQILCISVGFALRTERPAHTQSDLKIIGLPVGQGDGTIMVCPQFNGPVIIFDLGSTEQAWSPLEVKNWLSEETLNGNTSLLSRVSVVIFSHPHTDHYNYAPSVVKPTKRLRVFVGGSLGDYKYSGIGDWLQAVSSSEFNSGQKCLLDECKATGWTSQLCGEQSAVKFTVLGVNYGSEPNEKSVVLQVKFGKITTLIVGDFEGRATERELINDVNSRIPGGIASTVYKVSHHGASRLANSQDWLQAIQARWAFISSAYASQAYGHPKCETITRLLAVGSLGQDEQHIIACSDEDRRVHHKSTKFQIYSTRPEENVVCLISFSIGEQSTEPDFRWECEVIWPHAHAPK